MPDDVTPGELSRRLQDHEQRTTAEHRALDERITAIAGQSVPAAVYASDQRATVEMARRLERDHGEDVRKLREDVINPALARINALERRPVPTMTFGKWVAVLTLAATFLGVLVAAYATTGGAK